MAEEESKIEQLENAPEEIVEKRVEITPEQITELERRAEVFNAITEQFPVSLGKELSKDERDSKVMTESTLTYGEIDFMSIGEAFYNIKNNYGGILDGAFYDLGSGTGKGCLTAALLHPFEESIGIEILDGLYNTSVELNETYEKLMPEKLSSNPDLFPKHVPMRFLKDDFFRHEWSNASFVLCNSTCFSRDMMDRIGEMPVKPGTIGITLTKNFNNPNWEVLESEKKNMSWGEATVFISRRRSDEAAVSQETLDI